MADPITPITPPVDATADMLSANGAMPTGAPPGGGSGDATADMLSANGATPVAQPQRRSALKAMLLNFASGMGESLAYQAGIPQSRALQAQTATTNAKLPYVAPEAQAQLGQQQAQTKLTEAQLAPTQVQVPGPDGKMTTQTLPAFLAEKYIPQTIKYQQGIDVAGIGANSRERVAQIQQGAPMTVDAETAQLAGQPQLAGKPVGGSTLKNLNVALSLKGYKAQDLGNDGLWLTDRGGNKIKRIGDSPSVDRFVAGANARAATTPFSTVGEDGQPATISNLQAIQTGAPGVGKVNLGQTMGKKALLDDIHGGIDQMREVANVFDNPTSRKQIALALAQPGITTQTFLQSPLMNMMDENTAKAAVRLLSLKEQAMAMRSVLGAGQGADDLRKAIQQTIPGAQTPNSKYALEQLNQFGTTLDRLAKGIPNIKAPQGKQAPTGKEVHYKIVNGQLVAQ